MKYAIIGKTGKEVQVYKSEEKAQAVLKQLEGTGALLKVLHEAKPRGIPTKGQDRKYRASTMEKIFAVVTKGQEVPKYALYVEGILLAYTSTEEGALFLRRKARGFAKRVLSRKFKFRIEQLASFERKAIA